MTLIESAPLAALNTSNWTFLDNLQFALLGMLIVLVALAALWLLCEATGFVFKRLEARATKQLVAQVPAAQSAAAAVAAAAPANAEQAGAPLVVLAAAVAAVIDQPHRVIEVRPASPVWAMEGRRQVLGSHKLHR